MIIDHKKERAFTLNKYSTRIVIKVILLVGCIFSCQHAFISTAYYTTDDETRLSFIDSGVPTQISSGNNSNGNTNLHQAFGAIFDSLPPSHKRHKTKPMVLRNAIRRESIMDMDDIVLATHMTTNKFKVLLTQLKYWKGPASVAVYVKSKAGLENFFNFRQENRPLLRNVSFHFVMEKTRMAYPHNILRNLAMESIESYYFLALDVDFIPMPEGSHDKLVQNLNTTNSIFKNKKRTLFVLPAYELPPKEGEQYTTPDQLPNSTEQTLDKLKNKKLLPFRKEKFPQGHAPTNFEKWQNNLRSPTGEIFYNIDWQRNKKGAIKHFEPYVIGYRPGIPKYWEGKNFCS
jgi:hypothetical protein